MTQEEKARAYDEAVNKLRRFMEQGVDPLITRADVQDFFPELTESEDEKVRKGIIELVKQSSEILNKKNQDRMLAWLGKQGQVKESFISQHKNKMCKENGNSLTCEDEKVRKEIVGFLDMFLGTHITPTATPKQLKGWIAWLENIPYTIDHEKRDGFHLGYKACLERQGEQKPEENKGNIGGISSNWSEEDSFRTGTLISVIKSGGSIRPELRNEFVNWLKSLQDRVQPQPQPKYNFGDTELTQEELCEGLIRGMVDEHNRVTKEVLRNEYEKGRADVLAKIDAIDVDEMVGESCATSRVTQYWYAHGVNDVIKKLKEGKV